MTSLLVDELFNRLEKYWGNRPKEVKPPIRIVVCNLKGNIILFPVFKEDENFVYMATKDNIYTIVKSKCQLNKTEKKTLYYEAIPSEQDIALNKYPIRPLGCPKDINASNLTELANYKIDVKK